LLPQCHYLKHNLEIEMVQKYIKQSCYIIQQTIMMIRHTQKRYVSQYMRLKRIVFFGAHLSRYGMKLVRWHDSVKEPTSRKPRDVKQYDCAHVPNMSTMAVQRATFARVDPKTKEAMRRALLRGVRARVDVLSFSCMAEHPSAADQSYWVYNKTCEVPLVLVADDTRLYGVYECANEGGGMRVRRVNDTAVRALRARVRKGVSDRDAGCITLAYDPLHALEGTAILPSGVEISRLECRA
jgi:hypothetical protein